MEDKNSVVSKYNEKASIGELLKAQNRLTDILKKLDIFSQEDKKINGLALEERGEVKELWESLNSSVSEFQTRLQRNSNDSDILARLGPLTYLIDSTTEVLNNFLMTPIVERKPYDLIIQIGHLWNQSMHVTSPFAFDVNATLWEKLLSQDIFSEPLSQIEFETMGTSRVENQLSTSLSNPNAELLDTSQSEPEKADLPMSWGIGGAGISGVLMVAGVLATLLGGPIGAAIGIPLFALGAIGGIASASYIGYAARTDGSQVSEDENFSAWEVQDENAPLAAAKQKYVDLVEDYKDGMTKYSAAAQKLGKKGADLGRDPNFNEIEDSIKDAGTNLTKINDCNQKLATLIRNMNFLTNRYVEQAALAERSENVDSPNHSDRQKGP